MKNDYTKADKIRLTISWLLTFCGGVIAALVSLELGKPHGDEALGLGMLFFVGIFFALVGIICLLISLLLRAKRLGHRTQMRVLLVACAIAFITPLVLVYFFIIRPANESTARSDQQTADFQRKYRSNFIEYTSPPNWNKLSDQSSGVSYRQNESLALYLNQCEAGKFQAQYSSGSTYFIFSGIKQDNCVFYTHTQPADDSTWDGFLRQRCDWNIKSGHDNTPIFVAKATGIEFGDFLKQSCRTF